MSESGVWGRSPQINISPSFLVVHDQAIGHVILVDVADVRHGLAADAFRGYLFDVAEPDVRVKSSTHVTQQLHDVAANRMDAVVFGQKK